MVQEVAQEMVQKVVQKVQEVDRKVVKQTLLIPRMMGIPGWRKLIKKKISVTMNLLLTTMHWPRHPNSLTRPEHTGELVILPTFLRSMSPTS